MIEISKQRVSLPAVMRWLGTALSYGLAIVLVSACALGEGDPPTDEELCMACDERAECTVELGVATCTCLTGYQDVLGNGTQCTDIDECVTNNDDCHDQANCENTLGGYLCTCEDGYDGDGTNCFDINECDEDGACDANADCTNYEGDFACACKDGYSGDGFECLDVDECDAGTHACDENAICDNVDGSYQCSCGDGYAGDGFLCTDVDECLLGIGACMGLTVCANRPGTYDCVCPPGYLDEFGDSTSCLPSGAGNVFLIGHDYFVNNPDNNRMLGNAVFSANTSDDLQILAFAGYADNSPGQEVASVNAAINVRAAELLRGFTITTFVDYTQINNLLVDKHVLLIYEQEYSNAANMINIGTAWAVTVNAFVEAGGTVVATDYDGSTWEILHRSGLMDIANTSTLVTGTNLTVREPGHSLTEGVGTTYQATTGTRYYNVTNAVPLVSDPANRAVAWARTKSADCVVIDDFETGAWPNEGWWSPTMNGEATPSLGAAHDFAWGLENPDWHYNVNVTAGEFGERVRVWVRLGTILGDVSLGFGAADWGTYSLELDRWTSSLIVSESTNYSVSSVVDTMEFTAALNKWYQLEVQFGSGGLVTIRIFEEFNPSPLTSFNVTIPGLKTGGIAIRGSYAHVDTPEICPAP